MGITCTICSNHENNDLDVIKLKQMDRAKTEKIYPDSFCNSVEDCSYLTTGNQSQEFPTKKKLSIIKKPSQKLINKRNSKQRNSAFLNRTLISICILGPIKSGKTSFMNVFLNGKYDIVPYKHSESIEVIEKRVAFKNRFYDLKFTIPNKNLLSIKKNADTIDFFLLLYDINDVNSFEQVKTLFTNHIMKYQKKEGESDTFGNVKLIGNKNDLERTVSMENVDLFCKDNNIEYFEMNVKNIESVENIVNRLADIFDKEVSQINEKEIQ
jgi:GTPase SAR1 family protein